MNSSGGLLLVAGLVTLWLLAKGYGKNLAPAWQTLTGTGGSGGQQAPWGVGYDPFQNQPPATVPGVGGSVNTPPPNVP